MLKWDPHKNKIISFKTYLTRAWNPARQYHVDLEQGSIFERPLRGHSSMYFCWTNCSLWRLKSRQTVRQWADCCSSCLRRTRALTRRLRDSRPGRHRQLNSRGFDWSSDSLVQVCCLACNRREFLRICPATTTFSWCASGLQNNNKIMISSTAEYF